MRTALINLVALLGALAIAITIVPWGEASTTSEEGEDSAPRPIRDASGVVFEPRDYQRIASASPVADELLLELCEPDRIVAFTGYNQREGVRNYRYQGKGTIELITDVEQILTLNPDLVLAHNLTDPRHVERLREAGVRVFDFGSIEGLTSLWEDIDTLATLVGHPERGTALAERLKGDLEAIASDIPAAQRKQGLYVTVVGNRIYGGTTGSSYHDVLSYAGVIDIAAGKYERWPNYSIEQLLDLDPPLIVTATGIGAPLCALSALSQLQACAEERQGVVEIDGKVLGSGALGIVDAARAVRTKIYGPP
ncbi:MAG: ABC transporter substrate-binding protein [Deltaproteobacteria bacterium]|nr:ABC transporter substrate-binding protein [Deltaproteobacteria bacterium]